MRPPVPAVAEPPLVGAHRAVLETGGGQVVWRCARTSAGAGGQRKDHRLPAFVEGRLVGFAHDLPKAVLAA